MQRAFLGPGSGRPLGLSFRSISEEDRDFLCEVYASSRAAEMSFVDWTDAAKRSFLAEQFALQHEHYKKVYIGADFLLIEHGGEPIGRIYVYRAPAEIRLMDIALVPAWRGRGIGTALINELMDEARAGASELTLHVEPDNPAQRLYRRLGFVIKEHRGVYDFLGWRAVS